MSCECECSSEWYQEYQAGHLSTPTDFHTVENEEELLRAEFGEPDENGVYGARS